MDPHAGGLTGIVPRRHPYPYRAALTLCSDLDGQLTSIGRFTALRRFLNTDLPTPLGPGLNLEIGDSFWLFSDHPYLSYFRADCRVPSKAAPVLAAFIRAGYLDVLHTYGPVGPEGFRREDAERALSHLKANDLRVLVWSDHGTRVHTQNLRYEGALPDSPDYHADLLRSYGIRFVWNSRNTGAVGQHLASALTCRPAVRSLTRHALRSLMNHPAVTIRQLTTGRSVLGRVRQIASNQLLSEYTLPDGWRVYAFMRFNSSPKGVWEDDDADGLRHSISPRVLSGLLRSEGSTIVYTHLSKHYPSPDAVLPFPPETVEALRGLAAMHRRGDVWVGTTARLLQHAAITAALRYTARLDDDGAIRVTIEELEDSVLGCRLPCEEELGGVTFYTPHPEKTRIFLGEREVMKLTRNPADGTGRPSISIPLPPLRYPEEGL